MTKKVIATGATGFLGTALVRALRDRGDAVTVLSRAPGAFQWDPDAGDLDPSLLDGVDAVVNLSGAGIGDKRWTAKRKQLIVDSRLRTTSLLARTLASLERKPAVFVSASAIGYYGDTGDSIADEGSPVGGDFQADVCSRWESAADAAREAGIRVVHPRTGIVLAAHGGAMKPLLPLFKAGLGGRLGSGRQWWSWITLEDQVRAMLFLIDGTLEGPVNIAAPTPVRNSEFTVALGRVLRRPATIPVPEFALNVRLGTELAESLGYGSVRVSSQKLMDAGFTFESETIEEGLRAVFDDR